MVNADRDVSDIPTFEELKASGAPPVVPGEHYWMMFGTLPCCAHCGIVRRRDGKNRPCRGKVRVALRDAAFDAERTKVSSQASGHDRVEPKRKFK